MLCYHLEAKEYEHEGLVEEEVDVEKTQKSEQEVEKGFSTCSSFVELRQHPSCDESYEIPAPLELLMNTSSRGETSPLSSGGDNKSSLKKRRIIPWMRMPWMNVQWMLL